MRGHLFITRGDLLRLCCDAFLVPSGKQDGRTGHVEGEVWHPVLEGHLDGAFLRGDVPDRDRRAIRVVAGGAEQPAVWVGHTGASGKKAPWYGAVVTEFIRQAGRAGAVLARRPLGRDRPLVGLPLIGAGGGGMGWQKGEVVEAVVRAAALAAREHDVDVVLVLKSDEAFAAAQQARTRVEADVPLWDRLDDAQDAAAHGLAARARVGNLVAFVGAGASMGAGAPSWKELLEALNRKQVDLADLDARDQAELLALQYKGKNALRAAITRLTGITRVSLLHQQLASLGLREVVTTNYDLGIETAMQDAGRTPSVLPRQQADDGGRWVLKLHGSLDDDKRPLVLSRADYLRWEGQHAALGGIVQALLLTRHLLVVGYSMTDDNFQRILHQVRDALGPASDRPRRQFATAITPDPPKAIQQLWREEVDFQNLTSSGQKDVQGLAIMFDRVVALAASPVAHLLDRKFAYLFSEQELALRDAAQELLARADAEGVRPEVRDVVREALARLGGPAA